MINSVVLVGRLTKDPELKYTAGGHAVANFTMACDRPFKNAEGEKETDFVRIVVWRKQAENCAQYIGKGSLAGVTGRLTVRNYEDKEGNRRTIAEVVTENVKFLDSKKKDSGFAPFEGQEVDDSDIPF